ncbi:MAG: hypothetical protein L6R38_007742 [Xanthoria sp. 2 TBL-2021]|nr:MAG: hypothetical protein L6R38_007742 [Xanthoria sp. 2 TBL-2021]
MSFLKKYKSQFDDAKKKYMPKEEAHSQNAYSDQHPQSHQYGDPSQQHLQQNNNLTPAVPPGWTPIWDPNYSQWTYHNAATGQIQTAHPDPTNYGGQSMPPGGPVLDKDGKPKKDKNGLLMGAAGGLAGGMLGKWAMKKAGGLYLGWLFFQKLMRRI